MTANEALRTVRSLAEGRCPSTGPTFPAESPYQQAEIVRAFTSLSVPLSVWSNERDEKRTCLSRLASHGARRGSALL